MGFIARQRDTAIGAVHSQPALALLPVNLFVCLVLPAAVCPSQV
jgi:hypothetical protein